MKTLLSITLASLGFISFARGGSYSTEITMAPQKEKGNYEVVVQVAELVEQNGKTIEKLLGQPKLQSPFGSPSSMYVGPERTSANYANEDNITVDVSWPKTGETGIALCTVTVKRGESTVSRSKMQFKVEGR
jgi:hypothetical protein